MKAFLQRWLITTLGVLVAVHILTGLNYDKAGDLFAASLLLGIFNAFLRPILFLLALPLGLIPLFLQRRPSPGSIALLVFGLGLLFPIINALLLYLVGALIGGFHVANFGAAFWGAIVIGLISLAANSLTGSGDSRITLGRHEPKSRPPERGDGGDGPVIDV